MEGFLHNFFDIALAKLGVITRTRNMFVEIVAASERYLIINSGIKERAVWNMPSRIIRLWKKVNKKGKNSLQLIYNIVSFSKMVGKTESFSGKIS